LLQRHSHSSGFHILFVFKYGVWILMEFGSHLRSNIGTDGALIL